MKSVFEVDALLAQHVMGWVPAETPGHWNDPNGGCINLPFSPTRFEYDATELKKNLERSGRFLVEIKPIVPGNIPSRLDHHCEIYSANGKELKGSATERTAARAISFAALQAIGLS